MKIQIKRIYEEPSETDGLRVLVDRLWPRGVSKQKAKLDCWCKALAPSTEARKSFDHRPEKFNNFKHRYQAELDSSQKAQEEIQDLLREATAHHAQALTLLYAAKNQDCNHAMVLCDYIKERLKSRS